jgi:hypothetical protein
MSDVFINMKDVEFVVSRIVECCVDLYGWVPTAPSAGPATPELPDLLGIPGIRSLAVGMPNVLSAMKDVESVVARIVQCSVNGYRVPTAGPSAPEIRDLLGIRGVRSFAVGMANVFVAVENVELGHGLFLLGWILG